MLPPSGRGPHRASSEASTTTGITTASATQPIFGTDTKGNNIAFWLQNCRWDQRHSDQAVRNDNLVRIIRLSFAEGRALLPEQAELRVMAKAAGDAKREPDRDKKIITRTALRTWWETRTVEIIQGGGAVSGGKLAGKMKEAGLPDDVIELAVDIRRSYAAISRTARYLEADPGEKLQHSGEPSTASTPNVGRCPNPMSN
jgi:hypothetical protein